MGDISSLRCEYNGSDLIHKFEIVKVFEILTKKQPAINFSSCYQKKTTALANDTSHWG